MIRRIIAWFHARAVRRERQECADFYEEHTGEYDAEGNYLDA